jgi:hypothetical protein
LILGKKFVWKVSMTPLTNGERTGINHHIKQKTKNRIPRQMTDCQLQGTGIRGRPRKRLQDRKCSTEKCFGD